MKRTKLPTKNKMTTGSVSGMMKARKDMLPELENHIDEALHNYSGGAIAILMVEEDDKGNPKSVRTLITGVTGIDAQVMLTKGLNEAQHDLINTVVKSAGSDPGALKAIVSAIDNMLGEDK